MKLNLGCGNRKLPDYINCDMDKTKKPDKILDLNKPLPYKDNTITSINCQAVIEHIDKPIHLLTEIHRILKPNGTLYLSFPNIFFCKNNLETIEQSGVYHPQHRLLRPSVIINTLRLINFKVNHNITTKGLTGWIYKNNIDKREAIISLTCTKRV